MSLLSVIMLVYVIAKEVASEGGLASEEKVFVCKLLSQSFQFISTDSTKEYIRCWDKGHQRASSGPLRASATKGRSPLHFQSYQILQFLICVLKNLMVTSSASVHIDWTHFQVAGPWGREPREWPLAWETFPELELRLTPKHALVTFGS